MPIATNSNLKIVIPAEFDISAVTSSSFSGAGSRINSALTTTFTAATRTVVITGLNFAYLESSAFASVLLRKVCCLPTEEERSSRLS